MGIALLLGLISIALLISEYEDPSDTLGRAEREARIWAAHAGYQVHGIQCFERDPEEAFCSLWTGEKVVGVECDIHAEGEVCVLVGSLKSQ